MREELIHNIINNKDIRQNLIALKNDMRDDEQLVSEELYSKLKVLLHDADPKIRKNAALLLGYYGKTAVKSLLLNAYREEDKDFVKDSYLKALSKQNVKSIINDLKEIQADLLADEHTDSKHIQAQLKILNPIILSYTTHKKKMIRLLHKDVDVILTTLPYYQFTLFEYVLHLKYKPVGQGVLVRTNSVYDLLPLRNYRDMIIPIHKCANMPKDADVIIECFRQSNLLDLLDRLFDSNELFYYRLSDHLREKDPKLIQAVVKGLYDLYPDKLLNVVNNYEIEIIFKELREGYVSAYLKLSTLENPRFDYRKEVISNSMQPYVAATLLELAKPYMTDHAKVLDPFVGSGITLIERCLMRPTSFALGLDIYSKGLEAAKRNTKAANLNIHYVNKDALRFVNGEMFDEIITDMPTYAQMRNKQELEKLYDTFFKRIHRLVKPDGYAFIYTSEIALVEKNLRVNKGYLSLIEHYDVPRGKNQFYFFIIQVRS